MSTRQSLEELLDLIFGAEDLRRFVEKGFGRSDIGNEIQWDQIEPHKRTSRVVEALELHGAVDEAFFDQLLTTFPERAFDIEAVARQWLPGRVPREAKPGWRAPPVPSALPEGGAWDVFLAHAGPDGAAADQLYELLVEQGLSVFLDSRCLQLGDRWDDVIPAALTASRMVVVLVSKRTRDAYYTREEIALAIETSRESAASKRVIPVYLDRKPEDPADWLYGLQRLHGLLAADAGWPQGVVARIVERFDDESAESSEPTEESASAEVGNQQGKTQGHAAPAPGPRPTTYLHYLHMALNLNRSAQWQVMMKESRVQQASIFLLYGQRRQSLNLFVARLWHYLAEETGQHYRLISLSHKSEYEPLRSGAAWEINLRRAFGFREGTAADQLFEAARHQPVFLILGEYPLSRSALSDEEAIAGLEAFLEDRLPALLARCTGAHPIRVLLAIDYERPEDSLEVRLYTKIQRGAQKYAVRYRRLAEVKPVTWSHVKDYLDGLEPRPPSSVYRVLEEEYKRLDHGQISFQDLAERLSRKL